MRPISYLSNNQPIHNSLEHGGVLDEHIQERFVQQAKRLFCTEPVPKLKDRVCPQTKKRCGTKKQPWLRKTISMMICMDTPLDCCKDKAVQQLDRPLYLVSPNSCFEVLNNSEKHLKHMDVMMCFFPLTLR